MSNEKNNMKIVLPTHKINSLIKGIYLGIFDKRENIKEAFVKDKIENKREIYFDQ